MDFLLIAVVALGALLFGAFLLLLGFFFYFLYKRLGELALAVRDNTALLKQIAGEKSLTNLGPALAVLSKNAPSMIAAMRGMTENIKVWNSLVFKVQGGRTQPEPAGPDREPQSAIFANPEEDFGTHEEHEQLRAQGVNLDNAQGPDGDSPVVVQIPAE